MSKSAKRKKHDAAKQKKDDAKLASEVNASITGFEEYTRPFDGKPKKIPMSVVAFPARVIGNIMPKWEDIPEEFKIGTLATSKWHRLQSDWFYSGVSHLKFDLKDGFDGEYVARNLQAVNGSFEPKHEHKVAGFAYLCSLWLNDVSYEKGMRPETTP